MVSCEGSGFEPRKNWVFIGGNLCSSRFLLGSLVASSNPKTYRLGHLAFFKLLILQV